jgi:hypothetical protein
MELFLNLNLHLFYEFFIMGFFSFTIYLFISKFRLTKFILKKYCSFIQEMVKLLEPFEIITRRLSGGKYPTLNMVHPYMCMLKQMFAPRANENETVESYLELIYGPLIPENEEENAVDDISDSSSISSDDDISTAGNQHWQHTHQRQSQGQGQGCGRGHGHHGQGHGHGCGHGHNHGSHNQPNNEIEDINQVEYLPSVNNLEDILKKVRAAIYLSLEAHWDVPSELSLVATILDPQMKSFLFVEDLHCGEQKYKLNLF